MKKVIYTNSIEEVSVEEAARDFFDGDWNPRDWEETEEDIEYYIGQIEEISDKEYIHLKEEIKKEFDKRVSEYRQKEVDQLKNRESILNFIKFHVGDDDYYYTDIGDVGFILSCEEILDLILKNGNK